MMETGKRVPSSQNPGRKHPAVGGVSGHYGRVGEATRPGMARGKSQGARDSAPYPAPHPRQAQLVQLAGEASLSDLIQWIRALSFPASCSFVLQLLERYVRAHVMGDSASKTPPLPPQSTLLALVDIFVLHVPPPASQATPPSSSDKPPRVDKMAPTALNPVDEVRLFLSLKTFLEEQESVELRFAVFEALFGRCVYAAKVMSEVEIEGDVLKKFISLAVSLENTAILCCVGLWMQLHPKEALSIASSLYYDFCVLLPDAMGPLLSLVAVSPHMAQQMAIAFTSLYPLHIVGTPAPGVDPAHLNPPIKLLEILTHWLESSPEFLFPPQLLDKQPEQLSIHSQRTKSTLSPSLLAGLIQWCVLAPLVPQTPAHSRTVRNQTDTKTDCETKNVWEEPMKQMTNGEFDSLMTKLHADLLSVVLSHSKSFRHHSLTSDSVAVIVAAMLGFSQQQRSQEGGGGGRMNEAVERLSQFLQISLSMGILVLKPDDLSSMASTLPENRLLDLVIAHHRQ